MSKTIDEILKDHGKRYIGKENYEPHFYADFRARQAIREAIERARPNSEMLSTTTNSQETIFGFDIAVRVFERSILKELGLGDSQL